MEESTGTPASPGTSRPAGEITAGWRLLVIVMGLALVAAAVIVIANMADLAPLREDCVPPPEGDCTEYFDGSSTQRTITLVFGWAGGVTAAIAAAFAFYLAATGRGGRVMLWLTAAAIALGAVSIVAGNV